MKRIVVFVAIGVFALMGCNGKSSVNDTVSDTMNDMTEQNKSISFVEDNKTVPFFGKMVVMDDSAHIICQIVDIALENNKLSFNGRVLTVGDVGFGINLQGDAIALISSVQVDDPRVRSIIRHLDSIYKPDPENGLDSYYWWSFEDDDRNIRLRPLHSEGGGTTILFY